MLAYTRHSQNVRNLKMKKLLIYLEKNVRNIMKLS